MLGAGCRQGCHKAPRHPRSRPSPQHPSKEHRRGVHSQSRCREMLGALPHWSFLQGQRPLPNGLSPAVPAPCPSPCGGTGHWCWPHGASRASGMRCGSESARTLPTGRLSPRFAGGQLSAAAPRLGGHEGRRVPSKPHSEGRPEELTAAVERPQFRVVWSPCRPPCAGHTPGRGRAVVHHKAACDCHPRVTRRTRPGAR